MIDAEIDLGRIDEVRAKLPSLASRRPDAYRTSVGGATDEPPRQADRREQILGAAVRVFAQRGFHACRVSDIADEAGVAHGLLYHYFSSKDELLDTIFLERWTVMLDVIRAADAAGRRRCARSSTRSRPSSSTATATTRT